MCHTTHIIIFILTPVFETVVSSPISWFILIAIVSVLLSAIAFHRFDTLGILHGEMLQWYIRALVDSFVTVRITTWSFLAPLLETHKLSSDVKKCQQRRHHPISMPRVQFYTSKGSVGPHVNRFASLRTQMCILRVWGPK